MTDKQKDQLIGEIAALLEYAHRMTPAQAHAAAVRAAAAITCEDTIPPPTTSTSLKA